MTRAIDVPFFFTLWRNPRRTKDSFRDVPTSLIDALIINSTSEELKVSDVIEHVRSMAFL